mmetsp:Transcript_18774/g.28126  ORF Transcript_18774/g.28126 Transcript_18774/m.28126 type:complete len:461 (-) Transcript_18774:282-1664(-)
MTNSAVVASDALKGVISLVLMFLNGIQWFDMQSSQAPALRKNIYWAILVGLFLGFIQFLGENEPLIFPWQLVAFCLSCTQVICALLAVYLAHSVMFANYQTVNLGKKLPAWVTHSFSILALVYILAAVVSLGLGLAYNEIRFFAIRVAATGIFVGVAVLAFSFEMASLYRQAKASMEKHWSTERSTKKMEKKKVVKSPASINRLPDSGAASPQYTPEPSRNESALLAKPIPGDDESSKASNNSRAGLLSKSSKHDGEDKSHGSGKEVSVSISYKSPSVRRPNNHKSIGSAATIETRQSPANSTGRVVASRSRKITEMKMMKMGRGSGDARQSMKKNSSYRIGVRESKKVSMRAMRQMQKMKRDQKLLRKMKISCIVGTLVGTFAFIIAAIVTFQYGTSDKSIEEYYKFESYNARTDISFYTALLGFGFETYYYWSKTPEWLRNVLFACFPCCRPYEAVQV